MVVLAWLKCVFVPATTAYFGDYDKGLEESMCTLFCVDSGLNGTFFKRHYGLSARTLLLYFWAFEVYQNVLRSLYSAIVCVFFLVTFFFATPSLFSSMSPSLPLLSFAAPSPEVTNME